MSRQPSPIARLATRFGVDEGRGGRASLRSLLAGTVGTLGINAATLVLNLVLVLVLTRALGASEYGVYAFSLSTAMLLSVLAMLGLNAVVVRQMATYETRGQWGLVRGLIRRSHQLVAAAGCTIAAVASLVAVIVYHSSPRTLVPLSIAFLLIPLVALTAMRQTAMQGLHRVLLGRLPDAVVFPTLVVVLVIAARLALGDDFTARWAVGVTVTAATLALIFGGVVLARSLPGEVRQATPETETRAWLRSARPLLLSAVLTSANTQAGTILLGTMEGASDAGIFNTAFRVATFTSFVFLAASFPLMPAVARFWAHGEREAAEALMQKAARAVFLASAVIGGTLIVFAAPILALFGSEFESGAGAIRILVVGYVVAIATGFAGLALIMTGNEKSFSVATAIGVVTNILVTLALVPILEVDGAAIGFAAGTATAGVLATLFVWRRLRIYVGPGGGVWRRR
jgi:O-antigen/teichoic acid export membrane protein